MEGNCRKTIDNSPLLLYTYFAFRDTKRTSGSVVEYRLAKARVAGSNPVSCFFIAIFFKNQKRRYAVDAYLRFYLNDLRSFILLHFRKHTAKFCLH